MISDKTLEQEIMEAIHKLDTTRKRQVLDYARDLTRPRGTPGKLAVQYAREIGFSSEDLAEMEQAIEEAYEKPENPPEISLDE